MSDWTKEESDDLKKLLLATNAILEEVKGKITVASDFNQQQERFNTSVRHLVAAQVVQVFIVLALFCGGVYISVHTRDGNKAAQQCESLNESNAASAAFMHDLLNQFVPTPPPSDATQAEKDSYSRAVAQRQALFVTVDKFGTPKSC